MTLYFLSAMIFCNKIKSELLLLLLSSHCFIHIIKYWSKGWQKKQGCTASLLALGLYVGYGCFLSLLHFCVFFFSFIFAVAVQKINITHFLFVLAVYPFYFLFLLLDECFFFLFLVTIVKIRAKFIFLTHSHHCW